VTGKEWALNVAEQQKFWCAEVLNSFPEMFRIMYQKLQRMAYEGNIYGLFLELRYFYEALIRWYVLTGISYAEYIGNKAFVAMLFDPERSLSFGDWAGVIPQKLILCPQIEGTSLWTLLEELPRQYERAKIVRWRNDTVGHGALQHDSSQMFQTELEEKLLTLKQILEEVAPTAKKLLYTVEKDDGMYCDVDNKGTFPLEPFIRLVENDYRLFDSLRDEKKQTYAELSYLNGLRTEVVLPYFFDLRARYYGAARITADSSYNDEVFTDQLEATLQHFHEPQRYWKQQHYMEVLNDWMKQHSKGVFLFQSESGTGKSTFSSYLDGLGKQKLKRQGITCRCYYFSRMSFRIRREFFQALQINFSSVPENEDTLRGDLPSISPETIGEDRPKTMARFLNDFRRIHNRKFGRDRLLLILDGIDELQSSDTDLLNFVPDASDLEDGVYILITCRSEGIDGTFQQDFLQCFPFTEHKTFAANQENRELLKKAIEESVVLSGKQLSQAQINHICGVLNDRFTGLPVVRAVLAQAEDLDPVLNAPSLLDAYTNYLLRLYGKGHYKKVELVLSTLALAYEPLKVRLIAALALDEPPSADILAIMKDISPLLVSVRDNDGTKYILGHPDFGDRLRVTYREVCFERVKNWREHLYPDFDLSNSKYEEDTYLAGGVYLWSTDILGEKLLPQKLLENTAEIAGYYSQTRDTGLHMSRIIRIMSGIKSGYMAHWDAQKDPLMLARALDAITTCLHKLLQVEDIAGCEKAQEESEDIISKMSSKCWDDPKIVPILFVNYANRAILAKRFGDEDRAQKCDSKAWELLGAHSEWIRDEQQISFIHNRAVSLLQIDPDATIGICDTELNFPNITVFQRIHALTLKSDALKIKKDFGAVEICLREAVQLAKNAIPQRADEVSTYPNTLLHYGRYLVNPKRDFIGAIGVFAEALAFYEKRVKHGALPDRYEGASILSEIGHAYYGMDTEAGNADHKQQSLWYVDQSVKVYQLALKNNLRFQPAAAGPIYLNAAYVYHYYKETQTAFALINELEAMQNPDDNFGQNTIKQCADVRNDLSALSE
jgi:hypothetical protein